MERFKDFVSNQRVKDELNNAMNSDTLPHAFIIDGAKGTGKRTLSRLIAQFCVCSSASEKPCGVCQNCRKAIKGIHPDIITADGDENTQSISVSAIRDIRTSAFIVPNEAPKKVYLLFNCDKINVPAQNAFLKILEEPPKNVVFIMTCTSASALLETVRSRSRTFTLLPPSESEAVQVIKSVLPNADISDIASAASKSGGNIASAIELLTNGSTDEQETACAIAASLLSSKKAELLKCSAKLSSDRAYAVKVLDALTEIFAEAVKISVGADVVKSNGSSPSTMLAERLTLKKLFTLLSKTEAAKKRVEQNVNMNLFGAWFCSEMRI